MENSEESLQPKVEDIYKEYGVKNMQELDDFYTAREQELFISGEWDYDNPDQIQNVIREKLERLSVDTLTEDEIESRRNILWFWYHHAISIARVRNDKEKARYFADKAVEIKGENYPNKITDILHALIHENREEAQSVLNKMRAEHNPDIALAQDLIEEYDTGIFWPPESLDKETLKFLQSQIMNLNDEELRNLLIKCNYSVSEDAPRNVCLKSIVDNPEPLIHFLKNTTPNDS